jgi:transposase-like protein
MHTDHQDHRVFELLAAVPRRGRGFRYPEELKDLALDYAQMRRKQGASWAQVANELAVPPTTLERWVKPAPERVALELVPVVTTLSARPERELYLLTPQGHRLMGLSVETAAELLHRL